MSRSQEKEEEEEERGKATISSSLALRCTRTIQERRHGKKKRKKLFSLSLFSIYPRVPLPPSDQREQAKKKERKKERKRGGSLSISNFLFLHPERRRRNEKKEITDLKEDEVVSLLPGK